jgi:hypothetical protein
MPLDSPMPKPACFEAASDALRNQGWCLLPGLLPEQQVAALDADFDPIFEATPFCEGDFYGARTKRFGSLLKRSSRTAEFVMHPLILSLVENALGAWCDTIQLNLAQAIEIHPGAPAQYPHRDQDMWQAPKGEVEYLVNVMWPLTPFTRANGATLIYPGTHGREALADDPPGQPLVASCCPGTALVFLGSILHGAGAHTTIAARRGMIISYCLGWLKPYENQWLAYPPSVARRFEPDLAGLVGYRQHRPNLGNYEGVCPSILLRDDIPDHPGAVDALRPDQRDAVVAHCRAQTGREASA